MSLADVVLEIATEMEACLGAPKESVYLLQSYAKQLRRAVKAAEGSAPAPQPLSPEMQHFQEIQKARKEFQKKTQHDEDEERMVPMVGGKFGETSFPLRGDVPAGAYVLVDDQVYRLDVSGSLFFSQEETDKLQKERARSNTQVKKVELVDP